MFDICIKNNEDYKPGKRLIDITNQKFGNLFVLGLVKDHRLGQQLLWKCKCDCGNYFETTSYKLRHNLITSCGCTITERPKRRTNRAIMKQHQKILDILDKNYDVSKIEKDSILKTKMYYILKRCWNHKRSKHFERNFSIFDRRYLSSNPPTLQEMATEFNISRERVRQIESDTLFYLKREIDVN